MTLGIPIWALFESGERHTGRPVWRCPVKCDRTTPHGRVDEFRHKPLPVGRHEFSDRGRHYGSVRIPNIAAHYRPRLRLCQNLLQFRP